MRIAIVGAGISGLTVARMLSRTHDITVYESRGHLGGNARVITVQENGQTFSVDAGVCIFFTGGYPNFLHLLDRLGIETEIAEVTFAFQTAETGSHNGGYYCLDFNHPLRTLLRYSLSSSRRWLLTDGRRFMRDSDCCLSESFSSTQTLAEYLSNAKFSNQFEAVIISSCMAVWTIHPEAVLRFPVSFVFRTFRQLGFYPPWRRGAWHHIPGSVGRYLRALIEPFIDCVRLNSPVIRVERESDKVLVSTEIGSEVFDHVVFAIPAEKALKVIAHPSRLECDLLSAFNSEEHKILFTGDDEMLTQLAPDHPSGFIKSELSPSLSENPEFRWQAAFLNITQMCRLPFSKRIYLWYDLPGIPNPENVIARFDYSTPTFTVDSLSAQEQHSQISGVDRIHYCGSGWTNGIHEGGVESAVVVGRWFGKCLDDIVGPR